MPKKPGNRQFQRTQTALKKAFIALLQETNYESITVGDIADRANLGRSTFYRHYDSKPDILLSWHEDIFEGLNLGFYTSRKWLNDEPPAQLLAFFERMREADMPLNNFGNDSAYVIRNIGGLFVQQIETNLSRSFSEAELNIPLKFLAQAMAGVYVWVFQWWIMEQPAYDAEEMATYTHRTMKGLIAKALGPD